jgi:enolase
MGNIMIIDDILARKIFDSRGNPTIEVDVYLDDGCFGRAAAPAGASTGTYEAVVIPVDDAISKVEMEIRDQLAGENATDQEEIDALLHEIDGTDNFSNIGGNTSVAISMATAWAAADSFKMPLYRHLGGP